MEPVRIIEINRALNHPDRITVVQRPAPIRVMVEVLVRSRILLGLRMGRLIIGKEAIALVRIRVLHNQHVPRNQHALRGATHNNEVVQDHLIALDARVNLHYDSIDFLCSMALLFCSST